MLEITLLIDIDDINDLARPISAHVDKTKVMTYIREAQDLDVKPSIGSAMFYDIIKNPAKYNDLLCGGDYKDDCGATRSFCGLKTAIAYYAYARIVKNIDMNVTRFGVVQKDDEYSSHVAFKEKNMQYNDAFAIADGYLSECIDYLNYNKREYPNYCGCNKATGKSRMVVNIIGE